MKFGIDLGHCETAGAVPYPKVPSQNDKEDSQSKYNLDRLVMDKKSNQVIPTQIILTNEQMRKLSGHRRPSYQLLSQLGGFMIGKDMPWVPDSEKFLYFKVPPKDFDKPCGNSACAKESGITHGMVIACYAFALLESILSNNDARIARLGRDDIDLLIGCPATADWTDPKAREGYEQLIQKATEVHSVCIIPESRAAMFSSVDNEKSLVSAAKGAIVFDFGSSTADCTYMLLGRRMLEFSWTLGAFEVEHQMALVALEKAREASGQFVVDESDFAEAENNLRKAKEAYYSGEYPPQGKNEHPEFGKVEVTLRVDDKLMDHVTKQRPVQIRCDSRTSATSSWQELCRRFFEKAKAIVKEASYTAHDANGNPIKMSCPIDTIVLTGGASNMGFIYNICKNVFPDVKIIKEEHPSYTVSTGLAWVAVADDEFDSCVSAARDVIDRDSSCSIKALHTAILDVVFDSVCAITQKLAAKWAEQPGDDLTVGNLKDDLDAFIKKPETQKILANLCQKKIDKWKQTLSEKVETAVNHEVKRLYSPRVSQAMVIPHDIWEGLQGDVLGYNNINAGEIVKKLDLNSLMRKIGIIATQVAIWIAGGIFNVIIPIIPFVLAVIASLVAETLLQDNDLKAPRSRRVRKRIAKSIGKAMQTSKSEILEEFNKALEQQTMDYDGMVNDTLKKAFEIVTLRRFDI